MKSLVFLIRLFWNGFCANNEFPRVTKIFIRFLIHPILEHSARCFYFAFQRHVQIEVVNFFARKESYPPVILVRRNRCACACSCLKLTSKRHVLKIEAQIIVREYQQMMDDSYCMTYSPNIYFIFIPFRFPSITFSDESTSQALFHAKIVFRRVNYLPVDTFHH